MFCYTYVPTLSENCGFGVAVACVISAHYGEYYKSACSCVRKAERRRAMRLMFAAQNC